MKKRDGRKVTVVEAETTLSQHYERGTIEVIMMQNGRAMVIEASYKLPFDSNTV